MNLRKAMNRRGYTIVELLVVIAIIGLLATLGTYAWNSSGQRSRDSVRKSDLSRMENALQQYYLDNRAYPEFDNSHLPINLYAAGYQLANNTSCSHSKTGFLTPKFLPSIPQDPKKAVNFKTTGCEGIRNQSSNYLYLAAEKDSGSPRNFALMATLEMSPNDRLDIAKNPVQSNTNGTFRDFYTSDNSQTNFDPNYMISGSNGR